MTFGMRFQTTFGGSYTDVDITESGVVDMKLHVRKSSPAMLTWTMKAPQHQEPIPSGAYVAIWDDAEAWEGHGFGTGHPVFEGYCRATPGKDSNEVHYVAYDPTAKAGSEMEIMSEPWVANGSNFPLVDSTAIPRLVYNCMNDNDDDYAFERGHLGTLGQILAGVLDDALLPLRYWGAAPPSTAAYESSDLSGLTYIPQKKIVFQAEPVRSGVLRLLADHEPSYAVQFHPGYRKWRFYNQATGTQRTYTLNSPAADDVVLESNIIKSVEGCYTAVELYGPQGAIVSTFTTADGTLTDISGTTGNELETYVTDGTYTAYKAHTWQITNSDYRVGSRLLPSYIYTPVGTFFTDNGTTSSRFTFSEAYVAVRVPVLQASWDGGSTWTTISNPKWNFQTGTVTVTQANSVYIYSDHPPTGTTQHYYPPNVVRIIYAPLSEYLKVRYPTSGFAGTAYTEENVQSTFRDYHEMLAVGYERGIPVTTEDRVAEYQKLAQALHTQRCDIRWTGGIVLDGLKWDLVRLNRRVNLAGVDEDGNTVTTGMESMNAVLTDVEYDFDKRLTMLTFSSNALETMGYSQQLLMDQLRIKALARRAIYITTYQWSFMPLTYSWRGAGVRVLSGVDTQVKYQYYDPLYGTTGSVTPMQYGNTGTGTGGGL